MSGDARGWARAYRALHPISLLIQLGLLVAAEFGLFAVYSAQAARFHWATHFLVALAITSVVLLAGLLLTGIPRPRFILLTLLGIHLFSMAPDILFRLGVPHAEWMDIFLGHDSVHFLPGGDTSWLIIALIPSALYSIALAMWLRARTIEADAGMPPGVGLTGAAVLRPQLDPRENPLAFEERPGAHDPTTLLLHGLGSTLAFWRPVARELQQRGVRSLTPDLLGFGASIRLGTHFHLDDQAAAVIRLISLRAEGPVVLVAHSFGAAVAVAVARDRPDLVTSLVLVDPAAFADGAEARERLGGRSWLARKTMEGSPVADWACGVMCLFRAPLVAAAPGIARTRSPGVSADVARGAVTYVWPAYRDALASLLHDNPLPEWLARPHKPTTVLMGADDHTVIPESVEGLIGPDVRYEKVPGTHLLPLEHPAVVASIVAEAVRMSA